MLTGTPAPGIDVRADLFQTQTGALNPIDDIAISGVRPDGRRKLVVSSKGNRQVTSKGFPADFASLAWQQYQHAGFDKTRDAIALATRTRHEPFMEAWTELQANARGADPVLAKARIDGSARQTAIFDSLKAGTGQPQASDVDLLKLISRIEVLPFNFQITNSPDVAHAIVLCRALLTSGSLADAQALWDDIVGHARRTRLGGGTLALDGLWQALRVKYALKDHPDYAGSWSVLEAMTREALETVQTALPNGHVVTRADLVDHLAGIVAAQPVTVVHGASGTGKSALVKAMLDTRFPALRQVWMTPQNLSEALQETRLRDLNLAAPLADLLLRSSRPGNVLVIDSAERLDPTARGRAAKLIAKLIATATPDCTPWRVVIIGQSDSWRDGALHELAGIDKPPVLDVPPIQTGEVKAALRSSLGLSWLVRDTEALSALANLRTLAWAMRADPEFQPSGVTAMGLPAIVDRIWSFWTKRDLQAHELLVRLARRDAAFERSFPVSTLSRSDLALAQRFGDLPLRSTPNHHVEFEHDLAADWARFQTLREVADKPDQWTALASNPLWNPAVRLLGQWLVRTPDGDATAWDAAFAKVAPADAQSPLSADLLLDALFLDPMAERLLDERADLLFANGGKWLHRLLRRFMHYATDPGELANQKGIDPALKIYIESNFRTPNVLRWIAVVRFLGRHSERAAQLCSPLISQLCKEWLDTMPRVLRNGEPMPFRHELATLAVASARVRQAHLVKGVMFSVEREPVEYAAAFAAAPDLPNDVGAWALEMARRRPLRADIAAELKAHNAERAVAHRQRMASDATYRQRHSERMPRSLSFGPRRLPPWPLGAQGRLDRNFVRTCMKPGMLDELFRVRPAVAQELLLAVLIEDTPEEVRDDPITLHYGLAYDEASYGTAYWKSPFWGWLSINANAAISTLLQLEGFATNYWRQPPGARHRRSVGLDIILANGERKTFAGGHDVYNLPVTNANGHGQLNSAMAALEQWLCSEVDAGRSIDGVIERLLNEGQGVAVIAVLAAVGRYKPDFFNGPLRPLLGTWELYVLESERVKYLSIHFDMMPWAKDGQTTLDLARKWYFAPHRVVDLIDTVLPVLHGNQETADYVRAAAATWLSPNDHKHKLEHDILKARLDTTNYRVDDQGNAVFVAPTDLLSDVSAFQDLNAGKLHALVLPHRCEEVMSRSGALDDESSAILSDAMTASSEDLDPEFRNAAQIAAAATLIARSQTWLSNNPDRERVAIDIIEKAVSRTADVVITSRHDMLYGRKTAPGLLAQAVFERWLVEGGPGTRWSRMLVELLTGWSNEAAGTILALAHARRHELGGRWPRLVQIVKLWAVLAALSPSFEDTEDVAPLWKRWTVRLRRLSPDVDASPTVGDLVQLSRRVERQLRLRWRKAKAEKGSARWNPASRPCHGLDEPVLTTLAGHVLSGTDAGAVAVHNQPLLMELWAHERLRRFPPLAADREDHRAEDRLPTSLGWTIIRAMAGTLQSAPIDQGRAIWGSVLDLAGMYHQPVEIFIGDFFHIRGEVDPVLFGAHWREMLQFAQTDASWVTGGSWYYRERLHRCLLGFGQYDALRTLPRADGVIGGLRDLFDAWAKVHLAEANDNLAAFAYFLASSVGAPLRLDGLCWMAAAVTSETDGWRRDKVGDALASLIETALTTNLDDIRQSPKVREAVVHIVQQLVAKQVGNALVLEERVRSLKN